MNLLWNAFIPIQQLLSVVQVVCINRGGGSSEASEEVGFGTFWGFKNRHFQFCIRVDHDSFLARLASNRSSGGKPEQVELSSPSHPSV